MTFLDFICHRLPERSLWYGDEQALLCSRCTGLYVGIFLAAVVCHALKSETRSVKPSLMLRITSWLLILVMCVDVAIGTWHLSPGSNFLRLTTGFGAGCALGFLMIPATISQVWMPGLSGQIRQCIAVLFMTTAMASVTLALSASPFGQLIDSFAVTGVVTYVTGTWLCASHTFSDRECGRKVSALMTLLRFPTRG